VLPAPPVDTLIIGAGQAGLAAAYYLQQGHCSFLLLEAAAAVGNAWERRYDSLRLFSPAWVSGLPGLRWPGSQWRYPTTHEAAAYLQAYAVYFHFPIAFHQRVTRLEAAASGGFLAHTATGQHFTANQVIVATGPYMAPKLPTFAPGLPAAVHQLHSSQYQRPSQLPGQGAVAVVGSGNSALQIAADVAATGRPVFVAFDEQTPAFPNNHLVWVLMLLTGLLRAPGHTRLGRWLHRRPEGVVSADLARLRRCPNVYFIGRAEAAQADGGLQGRRTTTPPLQAVVWATGFQPAYDWIHLPVFQADGRPRHQQGLTAVPGLAFLGLSWLDSRRSGLLHGAGADARRVVAALRKMP
jgi:putative flavoprotein involved in K+ transport